MKKIGIWVCHHLYYNYVSPLFDRQFIYDSYSGREGKGTLLGIDFEYDYVEGGVANDDVDDVVAHNDNLLEGIVSFAFKKWKYGQVQ